MSRIIHWTEVFQLASNITHRVKNAQPNLSNNEAFRLAWNSSEVRLILSEYRRGRRN